MTVTPEQLRRLAALARIPLSEGEVEDTAAYLSSVLARVEVLAQEEAVHEPVEEPATGPEPPTPLRPDDGPPDPLWHPPASFAPAWAEGFFVVPRLPVPGGDASGEG